MSSVSWFAGLLGPDPKAIELVKMLTEKTRSKKLIWERQPSAITASIPPHLHMNFVLAPHLYALFPNLRPSWKLFTIRNQAGNKIVDIEKEEPDVSSLLTGATRTPPPNVSFPLGALRDAVNDLYRAASEQGEGDLEKALDVVNNL